MEKIDITQYKPQGVTIINGNNTDIWDSKELQIKELAEKLNEIIRFLNKDK